MKVSAIATFSLAVLLATAAAEEASVTPCPTTTSTEPVYDEDLGCWAISVEHDATYCIDGPICSGSGATPAGTLCPVKGDVAIADCHSYLASYAGDSCVLPVDATCQVIKTGAWGCVLSGSATPAPTTTCDGECAKTPKPTPSATKTTTPTPLTTTTPCPTGTTKTAAPVPTKTAAPTTTPCPGCAPVPTKTAAPTTTPCPGCTAAPTKTPFTPTPTPTKECKGNCSTGSGSFGGNGTDVGNHTISTLDASETSTSSGVSAGVIGAIAAAAAVVAVVAGAAIYKQYTKKLDQEAVEEYRVSVITP